MKILSFCKDTDLSNLIDSEAIKCIGLETFGANSSRHAFQVILSDNHSMINSLRSIYKQDVLSLIPAVALLKQDSSYSVVNKCISSGATALLVKI